MTSGKDKDKRTLVANLNDVKDSLECTASGERFKNICKFPSASYTIPSQQKTESGDKTH